METRLLSYAELGQALGITAASAKRLAIRRGWAKHPGNDGKARVAVPVERLELGKRPVEDDTGDIAKDAPSDAPGDITSVILALNRHIQRLEIELQKAISERDSERARSTALAAEAASAEALRVTVQALKEAVESGRAREKEAREDRNRYRAEVERLLSRRWWWGLFRTG